MNRGHPVGTQLDGQASRWRRIARSAVKGALAGLSGPAAGPTPRVLMYHSVDRSGSLISITPERFRQQLRCLRAWRWKTVGLGEAYGTSLPPRGRSVVLTFDDGFANFYTEAFPVLREFGMTACVFLVTDFIGGRAEWLARDRSVIEDTVASLPQGRTERSLQVERLVSLAEEPLLTWPQVREMAEAGIEFHGHTASHPFLPNLPSAEVEAEVRGCMEVLASVLGPAPRFFAYPYGASTLAARATLNALACPGAFTADPPRARERSLDPLAIPRVGVPGWGSLSDFRFRLSRGVELTGGLRKARALNGSL